MHDQTVVIIPAFNEEGPLPEVIAALHELGLKRIRVVDNGSTDRTAEVAREAGAEVISEPVRGYGQACFTGYRDFGGDNPEWVLFCDADGCDDLDAIPRYFEAAENGADLVIGNRRSTEKGRAAMTPTQNFGNWLATSLLGLIYGQRASDLGPMRLIRLEALRQLEMHDRDFGWTVEMQARAFEENLVVTEIPVKYAKRKAGVSKISGTLYGSIMAGTIILSTIGLLAWRRTWRHFTAWWRKETAQPTEGQVAALSQVDQHSETQHGIPGLPQDGLVHEFANTRLPGAPSERMRETGVAALAGILILAGALMMAPSGNFFDPSIGPPFFTGVIVMSLGFVMSWSLSSVHVVWFWIVALGARFILLPMTAGDDLWRYIWEGSIQLSGFSPYLLAPNSPELAGLRPEGSWLAEAHKHMNHPEVTAVYPPIAQWIFALTAAISPTILAFKLVFVAAEVAIIWLVQKHWGIAAALIVAWNPLMIYNFAGGAHYDSLFLLPLVGAWILVERGNDTRWAGLLIGISIAVKYLSAPLLIFLCWRELRRSNLRRAFQTGLAGSLPMALGMLWFANAIPEFQFIPWNFYNESVASSEFFDRTWLWEHFPRLSVKWLFVACLLLGLAAAILISTNFGRFGERWFVLFLVFSPAVHAWYFTWVIPWAAATRNAGALAISISGFVYFALPLRLSAGGEWRLTWGEWVLLWVPLLIGIFWEIASRPGTDPPDSSHL